jgi:signal transduction histidine kinase
MPARSLTSDDVRLRASAHDQDAPDGWVASARRHLARRYAAAHERAVDTGHGEDLERLISWCRVAIGASIVAAIAWGPESLHPPLAHELALAYAIYTGVIAFLFEARRLRMDPRWLHHADLGWATLLTAISGGQSSHAFFLFIFIIIGGGSRWGLVRTMADGAITLAVTCLVSVPALAGLTLWPFEIDQFLVRVASVLSCAVLFGALAERQLVLAGQASALASLVARIEGADRLGRAIREALESTLRLVVARQVFIVIEEIDTRRTVLWHARRQHDAVETAFVELSADERARWMTTLPEGVWGVYAQQKTSVPEDVPVSLALDIEGRTVDARCVVGHPLAGVWPWRSLMLLPLGQEGDWWGRLYVVDPDRRPFMDAWLRFLQTLSRQVGSLLMNRYLLSRLRTRIGSRERARVSLELHDSLVQSLVALEMRLDVLGRRPGGTAAPDEIRDIRTVLHNEILGVRDLMQRLQPIAADAKSLPDELHVLVERFARSTGIAARLEWVVPHLDITPRASQEIVRIVQEALINVRRHSGASTALVRVEADAGGWYLIVEDNGRGLPQTGRFVNGDPQLRKLAPHVIRERVAALGGTLTLVSSAAGLRLEMAFPPPTH